jgi:actin-related protein
MTDEAQTVIIDNGSGMVKAGFAGEDAPRSVFPAMVGRPKQQATIQGTGKAEYIGDEANAKRGILNLNYPIAAGIVESWDDMEKVWGHTFSNELRIEANELHGVLLTEAPKNPKGNREKMIEIMFEKFSVQNCYVALQAVMSLYAAGRVTGLVCDAGDGVSHTIPVYEGYCIPHAIKKMEIAGRVLTKWSRDLLQTIGETFNSAAEMEIVKEIKEKTAFVAQDYDAELAAAAGDSSKNMAYTLPDKRVMTIPAEVRMKIPELLFKPNLMGKECDSIQMLCWSSISDSDIDVRKELAKNIILSGGTTMYEGIADRLKNEVTALAASGMEVRIIASADRKFAVWKGASTLASLSTFETSWISAADYQEKGSAIVHTKCA